MLHVLSNYSCAFSALSHVPLFAIPWTITPQPPLSMEFSRHKYWSALPFPTSGNLPNPAIEPMSLASPASQANSLPSKPPRNGFYFALFTHSRKDMTKEK